MTAQKIPVRGPDSQAETDATQVREEGTGGPAFGAAGGAYGSAGGQGSQGGKSDEYPTAPGAGMEQPRGVAATGDTGSPLSAEHPSADAEAARLTDPAR